MPDDMRSASVEHDKDVQRRLARLAELLPESEAAAADADLTNAKRRFAVARREWRDLVAGITVDPDLAARFAGAEAQVTARDRDAHEQDAQVRREALASLQQLLARLEPIAAQPDLALKVADRALRDLRSALGHMPPLPSKHDYEDIVQRLKAVQTALTPKVQEMRAAVEWQRWANVAVQEQLCAKMEALSAMTDPDEIVLEVRRLQQQWQQVADVPRPQSEALWRRFKTAHDAVWARCESHFAEQAQTRSENLARKVALCERAEALTESTNWIQTAEAIKALQAEWKTVGSVTRGQEKAVWERFRAACDRFFTRRHDDLAERKKVWSANLAKKDALSARVEALADSMDWEATAAEIRRIQAEWKTIGPVKRSRSEAVWQRFRAACDHFFTRYAQRHDLARAERVGACESLCAELETLAPEGAETDAAAEAPSDLVQTVRALRARWQQEAARGLDRERASALDQRFHAAFQRVMRRWPAAFAGTDLDPESNRKRLEALVRRMEDLASSLGPGRAPAADRGLSPTTQLAAMLKEALAANTIGGKVDDQTRFRAAADELRQAQSSWMRVGPVPDEVRRALNDRFQRACRQVADRTGQRPPR
jgi:hypothetical protein